MINTFAAPRWGATDSCGRFPRVSSAVADFTLGYFRIFPTGRQSAAFQDRGELRRHILRELRRHIVAGRIAPADRPKQNSPANELLRSTAGR